MEKSIMRYSGKIVLAHSHYYRNTAKTASDLILSQLMVH